MRLLPAGGGAALPPGPAAGRAAATAAEAWEGVLCLPPGGLRLIHRPLGQQVAAAAREGAHCHPPGDLLPAAVAATGGMRSRRLVLQAAAAAKVCMHLHPPSQVHPCLLQAAAKGGVHCRPPCLLQVAAKGGVTHGHLGQQVAAAAKGGVRRLPPTACTLPQPAPSHSLHPSLCRPPAFLLQVRGAHHPSSPRTAAHRQQHHIPLSKTPPCLREVCHW